MKKLNLEVLTVVFVVLALPGVSFCQQKQQAESDSALDLVSRAGGIHIPQSSCMKKPEGLLIGDAYNSPNASGGAWRRPTWSILSSRYDQELSHYENVQERVPGESVKVYSAFGARISIVTKGSERHPVLSELDVEPLRDLEPGDYFLTFQYGDCSERWDFSITKSRQMMAKSGR